MFAHNSFALKRVYKLNVYMIPGLPSTILNKVFSLENVRDALVVPLPVPAAVEPIRLLGEGVGALLEPPENAYTNCGVKRKG